MAPRLFIIAGFVLLALYGAVSPSFGGDGKPTEYQVKAAYIYNFAKFVEWPAGGAGDIDVCVLGEDPFNHDLAMIEGKKVLNRQITIKKVASYRNSSGCDILFISGSEEDNLTQIFKFLKGLPVLTIGDSEGFGERGVMINFYMEGRTVRFEINPKSARRAGLRISSNLLRIAKIVGEP
jgi:hypothetical protein